MSLVDAVIRAGVIPDSAASQSEKKRYSELLSRHLAIEVAAGLRRIGFKNVKPLENGPGEKAFQGGLGPKKVDVSQSDEQHGLLLAVSIKSITSAPFGKNLKNRFYDLCPEAITLHLRFPYSVICALFCFPKAADEDVTAGRPLSTFQRAKKLLSTVSGRAEYTDPGEKFENVTMMLFQPVTSDKRMKASVRLFDTLTDREISESDFLEAIRRIHNRRNPHLAVGEDVVDPSDDE